MSADNDTVAWVNDGSSHDPFGSTVEVAIYEALDTIRMFTGCSRGQAIGFLLQGVQGAAIDVAPAEAQLLQAAYARAFAAHKANGQPDQRAAGASADALDAFAKAADRTLDARDGPGANWRTRS